MKKIGIITNLNKPDAKLILRKLLTWLDEKGKTVTLDEKAAAVISGKFKSSPISKIPGKVDLVISLGGDGTLLRIARIKDIHKVPILGINLGGLGFITEINSSEIYGVLAKIFAKKFQTEERMLLEVKIFKKGKNTADFTALNELVISKTTIARLLNLEVFIDEVYVTTYQSDGLIVSTPTGSTGHSLSAGGPIIEPSLDGIILTPICAHTLTHRPLIIEPDKKVRIKAKSTTRARKISVTIDGQVTVNPTFEDEIVIKKSPVKIKLIVSPKRSYYQVLREKLSWGKRGS